MTIVDSDVRQRSTVQLVKDLRHQATTLVHQEIELVKVELNENLELAKAEMAERERKPVREPQYSRRQESPGCSLWGRSQRSSSSHSTAACPIGRRRCVSPRFGRSSRSLALYGRNKIQDVGTPVPEKTIESLKEDVAWLTHQTS